MLTYLSIKNYLLIENIELSFDPGFSVITGETGAGKSIILGAVSLLLGKRSDADVMYDKNTKCVIEAGFLVENKRFKEFLEDLDIDPDDTTIIRREISPGGKTRAFVNDTPVNLSILRNVSEKLLDLHSQHENLILADHNYRLKIIDTIASTTGKFLEYSKSYNQFLESEKLLYKYKNEFEKAKRDIDYYKFQKEQIDNAKLEDNNELEILEDHASTLENAEEIRENIQNSINILENNDISIDILLRELKSHLNKISKTYKPAEDNIKRIESLIIEIRDIGDTLSKDLERIEINPELLQKVNSRINIINNLLSKHNVENIAELRDKYNGFSDYITNTDEIQEKITELELSINKQKENLRRSAKILSDLRSRSIPKIETYITSLLKDLGMEHAIFKVNNELSDEISYPGIDNISFLFSANKSISPQSLEKIASGGEFSRLMLALKSLIADTSGVSTIIFDEIDTGVSGEIANRMGKIMKKISEDFQVISITHLPQVAALGRNHFKVFKDNSGERSVTKIKKLSGEDRVFEIASMISGEELTIQAVENAKTLLVSEN